MTITIIPEPCGRTLLSTPGGHFSWTCTAEQRCSACRTLGDRLLAATYKMLMQGDWQDGAWPALLAWNLCLAALIEAPFERAITFKPCPPEREAELLELLKKAKLTVARAVVLDAEAPSR